jgi:hypothetical protein
MVVIIGGVLLSIVVGLLLSFRWQGFMRQKPKLETPEDLETFKRMVKLEMYAALMMLPVMILPGIAYPVGLFLGALNLFPDLIYFLLLMGLMLLIGRYTKSVEMKARTMPVAPPLARERDRVVNTWVGKALPDW